MKSPDVVLPWNGSVYRLRRKCVVSIPAGFTGAGLPVGLQLLAPAFGDALLLRAAHAFQRETDFHRKRPTVGEGGS